MDITKIDMLSMIPMISNLLEKVDLEKLQKNADIDSALVLYKIDGGKVKINLTVEPSSKEFSESFIEILKVVLSSNPKTKIVFKEVK